MEYIHIKSQRAWDFPPGTRVRLIRWAEDEGMRETLPPGSEGTVQSVDSLGTVHVLWDDGRRLGALVEDSIEAL